MLAIRMQRTGRSGHAQFRVIVQDSRFHPKRGKIVAYAGSFDPHTKTAKLDKDLISKYLESGAQPSDRVAILLKGEGVKLPAWVSVSPKKQSKIRNPEKLRANRPAGAPAPTAKEPAAESETDAPAETEAPAKRETPETEAKAKPEASAEPAASEEPKEVETPAEGAPVKPADGEQPA